MDKIPVLPPEPKEPLKVSLKEMLSVVAHAAPTAPTTDAAEAPLDEDTEERKTQVAKKPFVPADSDILLLVKSDALVGIKGRIQKHTDAINEFLLKEIAPRTIAVDAASRQSVEALRRFLDPENDLDIEIDKTTVMKLREFSSRAANVALARFVVSLFDLEREDVNLMLGNRGAVKGDNDIMSALRTLLKEKENEPPSTGRGAVSRPNA